MLPRTPPFYSFPNDLSKKPLRFIPPGLIGNSVGLMLISAVAWAIVFGEASRLANSFYSTSESLIFVLAVSYPDLERGKE